MLVASKFALVLRPRIILAGTQKILIWPNLKNKLENSKEPSVKNELCENMMKLTASFLIWTLMIIITVIP